VFPCVPGEKRPITSHGLHDATSDFDQVDWWWKRTPDANVAVPTGEVSGLVVLDIDDGGSDSLWQLEQDHGELRDTATVKTPRHGQHLYFKWPGTQVKTTAGVIGHGLDVRGDGGYVLVPPSRTAHGEYVVDREVPFEPMPGWLITLANYDGAPAGKRRPLWETVVEVPEGRRNDTLTRLVGHLLARNVDIDVVFTAVHAVNEVRCKPPLGGVEVDRIIESICAAELRKRQELWR
jgi:hypothetical protein